MAALVALLASLAGAAAQASGVTPSTAASVEAVAPATADSEASGPPSDDETAAQDPEALDETQAAALRDALNAKVDDAFPATRGVHPVYKSTAPGLDWDRTARSNGTTYTAKRALPVDWDARIGADLAVNDAASAPVPEPPALSAAAKNTGAAWANVKVPGVASFDARVGAGSEPSKLDMSRTLPLGTMASLTLQNSYAVTETSPAEPARPSSGPASVWSNDRQVKLNIVPTGTTFGIGESSSSSDSLTHNKFSAEQKLFDKFNLTTTLNDVGTSSSSRSITAGFKTKW